MPCIKMNDGTLMFSLLFKFLEGRGLLQFHQSPYDGSEIALPFVGETGSALQLVTPLHKAVLVTDFIWCAYRKRQCAGECAFGSRLWDVSALGLYSVSRVCAWGMCSW